jgi:excinuclease ABC subunit A
MYYKAISEKYGVPIDVPVKKLKKEQLDLFLYGTGDEALELRRPKSLGGGVYNSPFEGVVNNLERRYRETSSEWSRNDIEEYERGRVSGMQR